MSNIKILSEHLANQIAAGEVIERPASVVKELLENSIDAGARHISIEVEGNGTRLIRVTDDGMGMDGDDILLCLERHATSKLSASRDDKNQLSSIRTLGFRGEAIPSIASVARMTLISRPENETLGTQVEIRYGKVHKVHETGCSKGTAMEVKDLFGNLPARKKFLKSSRTELYHIEESIKNYALANHSLGVTYTVNKNVVLNLSPQTDTLEQRVRQIYGRIISGPLLPVFSENTMQSGTMDVRLTGFLLPPEESFGASAKLRIFVNGRAVKDRMLSHAIAEGLSGFLLKGRSPAGVIFLSLDCREVDVNVHPTKQEIRFLRPNVIHQLLVLAVREAISSYQKNLKHDLFGAGLSRSKKTPLEIPAEGRTPGGKSTALPWDAPPKAHGQPEVFTRETEPVFAIDPDISPAVTDPRQEKSCAAHSAPIDQTLKPSSLSAESLTPIGQFMDLYLLCEAAMGKESFLVVIDQHAAHERIIFEKLKKQFRENQVASQNLLFPKMLELTPESAEILARNQEEIKQLGLEIEEFGGDSFVIKAIPAIISQLDPEEILTGVLAQYSEPDTGRSAGRRQSDATRLDDIFSTMACKAAIKAGDQLQDLEIRELLKLMQESDAFSHCPHGRPVVRMFNGQEIKKWFHRT
ncbi:MAG: DNA mismatch repair endonuclease MutL [Proteobacteria bacterium]|nr:DNA mismatch repair endonuclease MutL [Pseudomonadota bacterium]